MSDLVFAQFDKTIHVTDGKSELAAALARIADLEAENAVLKQAAGALERLEEWVQEYEDRGYRLEYAGDLVYRAELVVRNWPGDNDEYTGEDIDTLTAAIDAALKEVAGE